MNIEALATVFNYLDECHQYLGIPYWSYPIDVNKDPLELGEGAYGYDSDPYGEEA